jgi:molybdopterin-binding protein
VTATEVWANDGTATVTSGGTTAPSAGTVESWTLSGSTLPAVSTGSTQCYVADAASATESEKMLITNVSGATATVTRGADGTTPVAHTAGFTIRNVVTRASLEALQSASGSSAVTVVKASGDTTGATDTPLLQAALTAGGLATVAGAQYYTNAPLTLPSGCFVSGNGATISPGSGFTGTTGMLVFASGTTQNAIVENIIFEDTWTINSLSGVYFDGAGQSTPNNYLFRVECRGFKGNGFVNTASSDSSSAHLVSCIAYGNLGDGFQASVDILHSNCEAGFNQGHGFHYLNGASNCYSVNCLAWFNGVDPQTNTWAGSGTSCGFFADDNSQYISISGCWAQQNGLHGYAIGATSGSGGYAFMVSIMGGGADTNSCYSANTGHGIFISGGFLCNVKGAEGANNSGLSPGEQLWGIYLDGACTNTDVSGNTIYGSAGSVVNYAAASGYASIGALGLVAATGTAGYALVNGTGTILSWTAPNDGQPHRVQIFANKIITGGTESGGAIQVAFTDLSGTSRTETIFPGGQTGFQVSSAPAALTLLVKANTAVSITQSSNLTGAATSTLYPEIWAL